MTPPTVCPGPVSRRRFLQLGALGVGLGALTPYQLLQAESSRLASNTSVILIWLPGGPPHMETYDMKPDAPVEYRGPFKPIRTTVPGMDVCDVSGEKVGTVARIHHPAPARDVVEVQTGLFGLGKHLYVPPDAVDGVTEAGPMLKHPKHEFHVVGLDARPEDLTG